MDSPNSSSTMFDYNVIPPIHEARTLVLCFDGTGDSFDADNSNVVNFFSTLKKDDRTQQMVYYQSGIGTYTTPEIATPMMAKLSKTLDLMFAWNLNAHVMDGYEFLMQNYTAGDKICIFGFSRGAHTARALAGMLHKVGLLPACNHQQVPFAYKMFTRTDNTGWQQSTAFKKAFSMDVDIEFIGVWDTVTSVGIISHRLPFAMSNSAIKTFRHAVSLDEHRVKFRANLWHRSTAKENELGTQKGQMPRAGKSFGGKTVTGDAANDKRQPTPENQPVADTDKSSGTPERSKKHPRRPGKFSMLEGIYDTGRYETDVLEVWFAGCHCDIGGGAVENSRRHNLARIPLRWMIRQCFLANTGIRFHGPLLAAIGLDPNTLYPVVKPRPPAVFYSPPQPETPPSTRQLLPDQDQDQGCGSAEHPINDAQNASDATVARATPLGYGNVLVSSILSEEEEDLADALCPMYDQLRLAPLWWLLEGLPMGLDTQRYDNNEWVRHLRINLGQGRKIPRQRQHGLNVHRSVQVRMKAGDAVAGGAYVPRATWKVEPTWVD
ncbi:hypothetical protein JB92DRAFT_3087166 [Gautieria morchelliformis]|nr:hypothetical protein JB92DRAFT_3087166 [Gautieria morchelliformis]